MTLNANYRQGYRMFPCLRRITVGLVLAASLLPAAACFHKKVSNPLQQVDSKQPDKVLFDRAMQSMKERKYDVARMTLQTLINTYPDSEYVARAKLAIGDSWFDEGGSTAMAQAESEYKDFITFFPNMPEAAEAQLKVANIHFNEMEKPDRDYTHAKRAEDEYRQLLLQYPDSKLAITARERLLKVQEVLAEREFRIGRFYFLKGSRIAAIARLKTLTDTYPLYSRADEGLYMLGQLYEQQAQFIRGSQATDSLKARLIREDTDNAAAAYSKIVTRYPAMNRYKDARQRLEALDRPVPNPTPEAIEQNKREMASRGELGRFQHVMENLHKRPDMSAATSVGEPTLVDPKQTDADQLVRSVNDAVKSDIEAHASGGGTTKMSVETINTGEPAPNQQAPHSDSGATASPSLATLPETRDAAETSSTASSNQQAAAPQNTTGAVSQSDIPAPAPAQVNEADGSNVSNNNTADAHDKKNVSTSKKKKKKLGLF